MTPFPYSVDINAPIEEAREFMRQRQIRHLPVTDGQKLVGVLTDRDIKLYLGPDFDYPSQKDATVKDVSDANFKIKGKFVKIGDRRRTAALVADDAAGGRLQRLTQ